MSRTRKDEPRFVKAKKHGTIKHFNHCGHYNRNNTKTFTAIFYAHQVREIEAFEDRISEMDGKFTKIQKDGFLATLWNFDAKSWMFSREMIRNRQHAEPFADLMNLDRVAVLDSAEKPNLAGRLFEDGPLLLDVNMSKRNIFYTYEVTYTDNSRRKHTGPSREGSMDDVCCYVELPATVAGGNGCSCCSNEAPIEISKTGLRGSLRNVTKSFNAGAIDADEDTDEESFPKASRI